MTAWVRFVQRLRREDSGQTLVLCAIFLGLVAIGFVGLAMDVGYLQQQRRRAQSAADAAALAASYEVSSGYSANEQLVANAVAKENGFDPGAATNPATVTLSTPSTGNFTGSAYVQANVSKPVPLLFMQAFSHLATTVVAASAIAGSSGSSSTCVCLTGSGNTLNISNGTTLNANNCGIVDNSTSSNAVTVTGGSTLGGLTLGIASTTWTQSANVTNGSTITSSTKVLTGPTYSCSPAMPPAPSYSNCQADPGGQYGTFTFGPASPGGTICYTQLTIGANGSTNTLTPGIYVINGGKLTFEYGANNASNQGGNGVFFYLVNGASLTIQNGANVNLVAGGGTTKSGGTAPSLGSNYNGYVFYQPSSNTSAATLQGGSSTYLNGSLYFPGAVLTVNNGSTASVTAGIVASSLVLSGGSTLTASATTNEGSVSTGSTKVVQ